MEKTKYRYRIPPCAEYDIPAMEAWLEDMAAKGLHLAKDGFFGLLTSFEEGPPKKVRFRLEPTVHKGGLLSEEYDPDDEQVQMLRQMGWVYRARRGQFHIYSSDDPHAPELNTDPQVQAVTMAALTKYLWKSLRSTLLLTVFYALVYSGDAQLTGTIILGTWRTVLLVGLLLWDLGRQLRAIAVLSRYRRQLQRGEPLPHRSGYHRRRIRHLALGGLRKALWILLIVSIAAHVLPMLTEENYVPLEDRDFPFATLEDLYPGAQIDRMDGILHSHVYTWTDPLSPENYDFKEYAEVTREGQTFDCYYTVRYHRTRWEWTARMIARELVSSAGGSRREQFLDRLFGDEPVEVTELMLPGADYCVSYYRHLPDPFVILQKNNTVLLVRYAPYSGAAELEPEELAQIILSQIQ